MEECQMRIEIRGVGVSRAGWIDDSNHKAELGLGMNYVE